jgi:AraC family transcriptional regulator
MDWLNRMNEAMDYIENNLADEIDYLKAAQIACCSTYHFQRMFSFITAVPLSEYIRRRRLTLVAFELQNSDIKVIDAALKYGYDSPTSFTRAFQNLHGVTPTAARDAGVKLKAYPRISFHISIKGESEMNYKIVEKVAFEVFGKEFKTSVIDGVCYKEIPEFWNKCVENGTAAEIIKTAGKPENGLLDAGVTFAHNGSDGTMRYMIACDKPDNTIPCQFTVLKIPALTWAVFDVDWHGDDSAIHEVWKKIGTEWFPTSSYEHADAPEMERYFGDRDSEYKCEIWIPVVKK